MTAAKCRNFKACCESGGTEKRRHALGTTSRHGTLLILPSRLPQIHSALAATAQRNLTPFGRAPMPPCSSNRGRPGMQIAFLPGGYRPCHPLPAPTALPETGSRAGRREPPVSRRFRNCDETAPPSSAYGFGSRFRLSTSLLRGILGKHTLQ